MSEESWTVVEVDAQWIEATRALFLRVFGHPMSEALWRWKYDSGRGFGTAALAPGGEMQAHYGGTLRQLSVFGHPALAVQIGDVMVAREGRAALAYKGPFGLVAQAFLSRHIGGVGRPVFGFGFPNARHMRLGEKLKHYAQVDRIFEMSWLVRGPAPLARQDRAISNRCVVALDWADPKSMVLLDKLWVRMRGSLGDSIVPCRDASWWRHRYANHPEHRYVVYWLRSPWTRITWGAIVLRAHGSAATNSGAALTWELIDWLAPTNRTQDMVKATLGVVRDLGGSTLMGWFSSSVARDLSTPDASSKEVCAAGVTVPGADGCFLIGDAYKPTVEALGARWWLTGGDTDFR